ncbi:MAG TPA: DUF2019 domain-containing protein [Roseiarcus sp.]|nr:DUF2019 domain-containing protein [Roseiarcus sp.]
MADAEFKAMSDDTLGERFRSLIGAYDGACKAYEHAKAAEIHREFYAIEDELRRRRKDEDWRRTGLEAASLEEIIERFKECAIAYEDADGSDETEYLYWDLDKVKDELQRRPGDQRRVLFALYTHPDIRVRQAAADATQTLAPLLSRHRKLNIDDDSWAPPAEGLDIERARVESVFATRAQKPNKLSELSIEQLRQRFVDLTLRQSEAEMYGQIAKYNRLYGQIDAIKDELKGRSGDQRIALIPLFEHPNAHVRLVAATATLTVVPEAARKALEELAESKEYPQAGTASGRLRHLDSGFFKPT